MKQREERREGARVFGPDDWEHGAALPRQGGLRDGQGLFEGGRLRSLV